MGALSVRAATAAEEERTVSVVALAFASDPMVRWGYPDPQQYWSYAHLFIRAFGGKAFACGTAQVSEDFQGAALWLPPGVEPDEEEMGSLLRASLPEERRPHIFSIMEQMSSFHPSEPHWYLPLIGVDPPAQRKGLGSALLTHALEHIDREGGIAYLEASSPLNLPLYERHGFQALGTIQSGESPAIVPMLRKPAT